MNFRKRTQRIRELNDKFRRTGFGGRQMITAGIQEMGLPAILTIRQLVAKDDAFCEDNDPYGEHDFGDLTYRNEKVFWKIDYYDATLTVGSPDPADPDVTTRVLTIMLASEY
ncbi:uncharacterized protein DUF3768 [Roseinatronobacter monicus]|uniref:Uncharacterized protein DUF3768 n=2 Tax=Roseinatronobacter monicus TaxID=393481 RepID=A0A543KBG8_9RHOB|nr:uncharacterized protein DUF3768 [Roseinatronobacter monicus]